MFGFSNNIAYVFYKRKHLLHFGEYSNSAIEGIHHGMKWNSAKVSSSHSLNRSLAVLTKNADRKESDRTNTQQQDMQHFRPYDLDHTFHNVIEVAKAMTESAIVESTCYECLKVSDTEWLVRRNQEDFPYKNVGVIPKFCPDKKGILC